MLKGTLDDFTLPDIFRLMSLAKRTGKVDVIRSAGEGKVFFREGEVYYAESTVSREPLGQKLIRSGHLTEGALMKALDENATSGARVGEILVRNGSVSEDQLQRAVQQQIEDSVFDLLRWGAGEFTWDAGVVADVEVPITVSVENLIIEASRRLDELEVIHRKIPSEAAVLMMAATPPEGAVEINITPEEWRMLVLVNGTRTVHDIAATTGTDDITAMRSLYGLVSAGLVEVAETGEEVDDSSAEQDDVVGFGDLASNQAASVAAAAPVEMPQIDDLTAADLVSAAAEKASVLEPASATEEAGDPLYGDLRFDPDSIVDEQESSEPAGELQPLAPEPELLASLDEQLPAFSEPQPEATPEPDFLAASEAPAQELEQVSLEPADEVFFSSLEESEAPLAVESFDAPAPDELVTQTPDADDFLNDLLGGSTDSFDSFDAGAPFEPPVAPPPAPEVPAASEPVAAPEPAAAPSAAPAADVDRASMVRELAGLFSDDVPRSRPASQPKASTDENEVPEGDGRKRVEDDDQVNKGLISRLIDGVKGL